MYKLDDVKKYIRDNFFIVDKDERIEYLYNMISNPHLRVNTRDKLWVAYISQASEDITAVNAIKKILNVDDIDWILSEKEKIEQTIDDIGDKFVSYDISHKARIPFYILVLDELIDA